MFRAFTKGRDDMGLGLLHSKLHLRGVKLGVVYYNPVHSRLSAGSGLGAQVRRTNLFVYLSLRDYLYLGDKS